MHKIFNNKKLKERKLSTMELVTIIGCMLLVDVLCLAIGTGMGLVGAETFSQLGLDGALAERTLCTSSGWLWAEFAFKATLLLAGCVLSFKTRNVDPSFSESRALMLIMYNAASMCIIVYLLQSISGIAAAYQLFAHSFGIAWSTIGSTLFLLAPRFVSFFFLSFFFLSLSLCISRPLVLVVVLFHFALRLRSDVNSRRSIHLMCADCLR